MPTHMKKSIKDLNSLSSSIPNTRVRPKPKVIDNEIKEEKTIIDSIVEKEEKGTDYAEEIAGRETEIKESDEESISEMRKLSKTRRVRRPKRNRVTPKSGIIGD